MFIVTSSKSYFDSAYNKAKLWQEKTTGFKQAITQAEQNYQKLKDKQEPKEKLEEAEKKVKKAKKKYREMQLEHELQQFHSLEDLENKFVFLREDLKLRDRRVDETIEDMRLEVRNLPEHKYDINRLRERVADLENMRSEFKTEHEHDINRLSNRIADLQDDVTNVSEHDHIINRLSQKVADLEKQMKNTLFEKIKDNTVHCFDKVKSCMKRSKKLCMKKKSH
jgi:chromosome segregation ATPase